MGAICCAKALTNAKLQAFKLHNGHEMLSGRHLDTERVDHCNKCNVVRTNVGPGCSQARPMKASIAATAKATPFKTTTC